jgi:hypothetical protein
LRTGRDTLEEVGGDADARIAPELGMRDQPDVLFGCAAGRA